MQLTVPANCRECGLYESCTTWKIPARSDRLNSDGTADLLFIGQAPGYYEDRDARIFTGPSGKYLQNFLDRLECTWVLDNSVKCYPGRNDGGGDHTPSPAQIALCSSFLWESINKYKPKVIICLGAVAMRAVLGDKAPRSLTKAAPLQQMDNGQYVIILKHPANHVSGREDLTDRYITALTQAERIVKGEEDEIPFQWVMVDTAESLWAYMGNGRIPIISLDTEVAVSSANPRKLSLYHPESRLLSVQVTHFRNDKYHNLAAIGDALCPHSWKQILKDKVLWAHNTKFDMNVLWWFMKFNPWTTVKDWNDTFLNFFLLDQSKLGNSLKNLAEIHLGAMPWADGVWKWVDERNRLTQAENRARARAGVSKLLVDADFGTVLDENPDLLCEYGCRDTFYTDRLRREILPTFQSEVPAVALELSLKASYALSRVERYGLPVSEPHLDALIHASDMKIRELTELLHAQPEVELVENGFNKIVKPGVEVLATPDEWSPPEPKFGDYKRELDYHADWAMWLSQTRTAHYSERPQNVKSWKFMEAVAEVTQHHTGDKTPSGRLKFDAETLKKLAGVYPPVADEDKTRAQWIYYYLYHIRQHRDLGSKFLSNLRAYTVDGRVHTSYRLGKVDVVGRAAAGDLEGGALSGRLSSSNPNLQNIKQDKVLRSVFRAPPGTVLVESDYDRIELVVLAELSQDKNLLEHVAPGNDPHARMGERIAKILGEIYNKEFHRDLGKRANFGKVYGQTAEALARMANIPYLSAMKVHEAYDTLYPGVLRFFDETDEAITNGEAITTPFGRKRTGKLTGHPGKDGHTRRSLKNFRIQGTASDICLWKLIEIFEWLDEEYEHESQFPFHPVNIIHDSHTNEIKNGYVGSSLAAITEIMEDMDTLPIPFGCQLKVTHKQGPHLGDMREI